MSITIKWGEGEVELIGDMVYIATSRHDPGIRITTAEVPHLIRALQALEQEQDLENIRNEREQVPEERGLR